MKQPGFSKEVVDYIFKNYTKQELLEKVNTLLDEHVGFFSYDLAEYITNSLEGQFAACDIAASFASDSENAWKEYVQARLAAENGNILEAIKRLDALIIGLPQVQQGLLLQQARLLVRARDFTKATDNLKCALETYPEYPFFVKCEKILGKVVAAKEWKPKRTLKIALLGSSTTALLAPVLQAICFREDIKADVYQGSFGNYHQEILNPASNLYVFKPDVTIIIPNTRELSIRPFVDEEQVHNFTAELINLWAVLKNNHPCHIIQVGLGIPESGAGASLEELENGRAWAVGRVNAKLAENAGKGVSFLDINRIARKAGQKFYSDIEWYMAKQYPAADALPFFADCLTAQIKAVYGLTAKMLIVDLDNTLWGGVIGEDGLGGIVVGPPSPEGEAFQELQEYLKELKTRGILLAVCSKNNIADAKLPFQEHDAMVLKLEDFVLFTANWKDKASNILEMAGTLALGLDSFVFLDDNPLERAWVREKLPQVIVPECGSKPWEMLRALRRGMYFESVFLTNEDKQRHESYKANVERQEYKKHSGSLEDFLLGLGMEAQCGEIEENTLVRAAQLINKTNQFNLTTRRYSEEQLKAMTQLPHWWTRWYRLKDRFGDHGLIGIILVKQENDTWLIDTWLMSCRVLGRQMEQFMCRDILKVARSQGISRVYGEYLPTAKNVLVKDLYAKLGFSYDEKSNRYFFDVATTELPSCSFIEEGQS